VSKRDQVRYPLLYALILLVIGSTLAIFSGNIIVLFLCAELVSVAALFTLFLVIIPALFPRKVEYIDTFTGGVAKPPYLSFDEVYAPKISILSLREERGGEESK